MSTEQSTRHAVQFADIFVLREVAGQLGGHLKQMEKELGVSVKHRGDEIVVKGDRKSVQTAVRLLHALGELTARGRALHPTDVSDALRLIRLDPEADISSFFRDVVVVGRNGTPITARTLNQAAYIQALRRSDVVFGVGPAGTGKTYLAMAMAVSQLKKGRAKRILLTRPAVEAGEKLGFLPGDLAEKIDPYLRPLFDALLDMLEPAELDDLMEKGIIEVAPLAFMRGRTLSNAFVVLDEAQNTTAEQMKMFLTRLGDNGRMVITGDASQVDLPRGKRSGLAHAVHLLGDIPGIEVVRLSADDVVRHPLVAAMIEAYDEDDAARMAAAARRARSEEEA